MSDLPTPDPTKVEKPPETTPDPSKMYEGLTPEAKALAEKAAADKTAADAKTAADKKTADDAAAKKAADEKEGKKPDALTALTEADITIPDGFEKDDALMGEFLKTVNDAALDPKARANAMIGLYAKAMKQVSEKGNALFAEMQKKWTDETSALPDIGGTKLDETLGGISKLLDKYSLGPDGKSYGNELRQVFDLTGAGNNPYMVRFLNAVTKDLIKEGSLTPAGRPGGGDRKPEDILYST